MLNLLTTLCEAPSQNRQYLKDLFRERVSVSIPAMEYSFVDGYSLEGKLVEIEVTAIAMRNEGTLVDVASRHRKLCPN